MTTPVAPTVFISYCHKDEKWKDLLMKHLRVLHAQGFIGIWQDRDIGAGAAWHANIQEAAKSASIAVLIITANFLSSEYILNEEIPPLLEQHRGGTVRIFPLIAEPCAWQTVGWLRQMNLRPTDARPLSAGSDNQIDADLAALATEIHLLTKSAAAAAASQREFVPLNPDNISIGRLPVTGSELIGRELELDMLDGAWADPNTNLLTLVALGGVGKSALVNHWRRRLARDNYRGAEKVYAWSFYRQGTSEQGVSADQFIDAALRWFGDPDSTAGTPWDKGERLARLIKKQRTLLLLDGLEPLQFPPGRGHQDGALKEHTMQALLRELAAHNPGLCLITSRLAVADLADSEGDTARRLNLEHLSRQAGAEVLRRQGVQGPPDERERASAEFGGHALAVTLLGSYLVKVYEGDVACRDQIEILREDEDQGGHARRVMASYEKGFGEGPELCVLRILGLFDRPADGPSIAAVLAPPAIPGLTDALLGITEEDWRRTLHHLRAARLIADRDPDHPETLDAHPLVREYFKQRLKSDLPDAWREGNHRLYRHLTRMTKQFPDTFEEMAPLYAAIVHGCAAGHHEEALRRVYYVRIQRGREVFYSTTVLGAISAELSALYSFFEIPWRQPVMSISEPWRAFLFGQVGHRLRALGRLREAIDPMSAALTADTDRGDWMNASIDAVTLSSIYQTLGELKEALVYGEQGVALADRSGDQKERVKALKMLAYVLYKAGRLSEAEQKYLQAEQIWRSYRPGEPFTVGYRHRALLLRRGRYREAQAAAEQVLATLQKKGSNLTDFALAHLSIGRALLLQAETDGGKSLGAAEDHLRRAMNYLRDAGRRDHFPRGLLALAESHIKTLALTQARAEVDEAAQIAALGRMGLYQADCHLVYARLSLAQGETEKARQHWQTARDMIERTGYHLRDGEVREIEEQLGERADG